MQASIDHPGSTDQKVSRSFESEIKVRWNEMDANGHVNNSVFMQYFDQARIEAFATVGFGADVMREKNMGPVIYNAQIDYKKELKHPDSVRILTQFTDVQKSRGTVVQNMFSATTGDLISSAQFKGIFMDFSRKRPVPFPEEFLKRSGLQV